MKKIIAILGLLLLPFMCFAQLRSQVCIIKQNYDDTMIETIKKLKSKLQIVGVEDTDKYIEDFIKNGSFGSGFLYVAPDGKNYVITNRHVIEDSKSVTVIFQNEDGDLEKEYKDIQILAADAEIDVAVLSFPEGEAPYKESLPFCTEKIYDGDSVFSAGFPSLLGKPSWQFGAGTITNASLKSEEFIKPEISSVIQHSAQVDPGNSGGPLLVKDKDGIYKIAGINTWKASSRQDTNFAVPIATVEKFINNVLSPEGYKAPEAEKAIISRAESLQKILNRFSATFEEIAPFISMDYVTEEGSTIFKSVVSQCSDENRRVIYNILSAGYPVEAMRYAIGWFIFNKYHQYEVKQNQSQKSTVSEDELPEIPFPVKYEDKDVWYTPLYQNGTNRYVKFEWINVNGGWQLYSCSNISKKEMEKQNLRMNDNKSHTGGSRELPQDVANAFNGAFSIYLPTDFSIAYRLEPSGIHTADVEFKLNNYLSLDSALSVEENLVRIYDFGTTPDFIYSAALYAGIQLQLPLWHPMGIIMPYVTIQGGYKLKPVDSYASIIAAQMEAGCRLNFFVSNNNTSLFVEVVGVFESDIFNCSNPDGVFFDLGKSLGIGLGIAF